MLNESSDRERVNKTTGHDDSSTSKNEKSTNREANLFLMNKHPELFDISPRPGGYLRHLATQRKSSHSVVEKSGNKPNTSASTTTNGSNTIGRAINISEILETSYRCPSARRPVSKEDQRNNTVRMCSIAISTVMMLAQHIYEDITSEHVRHTEEYFRGLKQADGFPHNVGQLVNLLTHLQKSGRITKSSIDGVEHNIEEKKYEDSNSAMEISDLIK